MLSYNLGVGCLDVGSLGGCSRGNVLVGGRSVIGGCSRGNVLVGGRSVIGGACSGAGCCSWGCCSCFILSAVTAVWSCVVEVGASSIGVSVMGVYLAGGGVKDVVVLILLGDSRRDIVAMATARCPLLNGNVFINGYNVSLLSFRIKLMKEAKV